MSELLESRNQLELRTLELQRLSGQFLAVQDEERRRIARELHDDLGQELAALKMTLEMKKQDADAIEMAERANQKVRNLSYLLHPPLLDESGLVPALHWFVEGFRKRSDLRFHSTANPDRSLGSRKKSRLQSIVSFRKASRMSIVTRAARMLESKSTNRPTVSSFEPVTSGKVWL
jgi:signal transduction histidine kinase